LDSIAYLVSLLLAEPFVRAMDDRLCCVVQIHLFLILLIGYTLQQSTFQRNATEDVLGRSVYSSLWLVITLTNCWLSPM
jgi:hypothetical protein